MLTHLVTRLINWLLTLCFRRHNFHIKQARKVLSILLRLRSIGVEDERVIPFLRMISPSTFEEMVLAIAEGEGCYVWRLTGNSGRGRFDGKVDYCGETWLIQCKRYKSEVKPSHVRRFARLANSLGMRGLFIHTGDENGREYSAGDKVKFLSGDPLVKVMLGEARLVDQMYGWKTQTVNATDFE